MSKLILHFTPGPNGKKPYPIAVEEDNKVRSGLGEDDGKSWLIGVGPRGEQSITHLSSAVRKEPGLAVGLSPSFSDGDGFFLWDAEISRVEVRS